MRKIYIGTSGWSYKEWAGNFYPDKMKPADYLGYYAERFNTVEIDSTFYRIPTKSMIENWYNSVPADFKFSAKFPQSITHDSDLTGIEDILSQFIKTISLLEEKLGILLLQFPYSFKPEMTSNLNQFIKLLPSGLNYVIEIRNRKWLDEKFYDMLRKNSIGLALLDHPWMPKPQVVTSRVLYIRFLGDRQKIPDDFTHEHIDRGKELSEWERMIRVLEEKVDDFYGYFNNHYSGHSPTTASRFIKIIEERYGDVKKPNLAANR